MVMFGCECPFKGCFGMFGRFGGVRLGALPPFGAGRPPRNPLGVLKALIVKCFRGIPSDRQLYRHLWSDPELRHLCARAMHNSHATPGFNSNKTRKTRTNKGNNKANIKLTRKHQFSNT
jgi:transposase